jgi:hypothetical protein
MESLLSLVGLGNVTPQGIRLGLATVLALMAVAPNRPSNGDVVVHLVFAWLAGLMVAEGVSFDH